MVLHLAKRVLCRSSDVETRSQGGQVALPLLRAAVRRSTFSRNRDFGKVRLVDLPPRLGRKSGDSAGGQGQATGLFGGRSGKSSSRPGSDDLPDSRGMMPSFTLISKSISKNFSQF